MALCGRLQGSQMLEMDNLLTTKSITAIKSFSAHAPVILIKSNRIVNYVCITLATQPEIYSINQFYNLNRISLTINFRERQGLADSATTLLVDWAFFSGEYNQFSGCFQQQKNTFSSI
jgi:hypothetical protein